jgi:hypothetical protein
VGGNKRFCWRQKLLKVKEVLPKVKEVLLEKLL